MSYLPTILLILAGISIGATVIAVVVTLRSAREARTTLFPIVREEETARSHRARVAAVALTAMTALFLGGWLATLRLTNGGTPAANAEAAQAGLEVSNPVTFAAATTGNNVEPPSTESETVAAHASLEQTEVAPLPPAITSQPSLPSSSTATLVSDIDSSQTAPTPAPTATPQPLPTATPSQTASPTPSATPSPAPPTPTFTLEPAVAARIPTSAPRTPAPPGARIGPIEFATGVTGNVRAINPGDTFPVNVKSVYAVYPYSGMRDGLEFAAVWYQDGVELLRNEAKWQWGREARSYSYLNPPGEGLYKLELYVNDSVVATGLFEVR